MACRVTDEHYGELLKALTLFPAGEQRVALAASNRSLRANLMMGVVQGRAWVPAEGDLEPRAVDLRLLLNAAAAKGDVVIGLNGDAVRFTRGKGQWDGPWQDGEEPEFLKMFNKVAAPLLSLKERDAEAIRGLSALASRDGTRPELNCVMLDRGWAMACGQKVVIVVPCSPARPTDEKQTVQDRAAMPILAAEAVQPGDEIRVGPVMTALTSGRGKFMLPTPVTAQKQFPVERVMKMGRDPGAAIAVVKAGVWKEMLSIAAGSVVETGREAQVVLGCTRDELRVHAHNDHLHYRTVLPAEKVSGGITVVLPLPELKSMAPLIPDDVSIVFEQMAKGETVLRFGKGRCILPAWKRAN